MEEFNDTINLGEDVVKVLKGIFDLMLILGSYTFAAFSIKNR